MLRLEIKPKQNKDWHYIRVSGISLEQLVECRSILIKDYVFSTVDYHTNTLDVFFKLSYTDVAIDLLFAALGLKNKSTFLLDRF